MYMLFSWFGILHLAFSFLYSHFFVPLLYAFKCLPVALQLLPSPFSLSNQWSDYSFTVSFSFSPSTLLTFFLWWRPSGMTGCFHPLWHSSQCWLWLFHGWHSLPMCRGLLVVGQVSQCGMSSRLSVHLWPLFGLCAHAPHLIPVIIAWLHGWQLTQLAAPAHRMGRVCSVTQ